MKHRHTYPATTRRLLQLLAALCLCVGAAAQSKKEQAQVFAPTAAQRTEAARMRRALADTLGERFEVSRDRLTRRSNWHGGALYWLAHLRARRPGEYYVRYKYRYKDRANPRDPLYTFVEHQTLVRVGPRSCERRPRYNSVCVGDTIILPVLVGDHTEHTFSLEVQSYAPGDPATAKALRGMDEVGLYREPVPNPAAEFMKYLGSRAHYSPHRASGYTADYEAIFEAVGPGSFNLSVRPRMDEAVPPTATHPAGSVPIVVVEKGAPITVLSSGDNVHGYTVRFSSRSGNSYLTTPVILQVGERLKLKYLSYSRRGLSAGGENEEAVEARVKDSPPVITLLPFRFDPAQDFNEWASEFLPPSRRE
jgi:hypothetical protein